jgi:hypothetical protein
MKIISKFKDYYDFVAGYDTDPRKVYDRSMRIAGTFYKDVPKMKSLEWNGFYLGEVWFCDTRYPYLYDRNGDYHYDYYQIPEATRDWLQEQRSNHREFDLADHWHIRFKRKRGSRKHPGWMNWLTTKEEKINTRFRAPIIFTQLRDELYQEIVFNGRLSDVNFQQVMSPAEAFTTLYNWIPYHEPEMPSDPTDMGRFENKGFDTKTSFRGKKQ